MTTDTTQLVNEKQAEITAQYEVISALNVQLAALTPPQVTVVGITPAMVEHAIVSIRPDNGVPSMPFILDGSPSWPYQSCSTDDFNAYLTWWKTSAVKLYLTRMYESLPNACIYFGKAFGSLAELAGLMTVGMVNDGAGGHCYNVFVDSTGKGWVIEPQYGTYVFEAPPGGELGMLDPTFYQIGKLGTTVII